MEANTIYTCIFCQKQFNNKKSIHPHQARCNNNELKIDTSKKRNRLSKEEKIKTCTKCGSTFSNRRKYCSDACSNKLSEETKIKISESRKKYLKENPDKHPWKNKNKYISSPCEYLKTILKSKNIEFVEEHSPLIDKMYSIDIAFPYLKVGIEVNGNQHYNKDKTLAQYYQQRHDEIENNGWVLHELHYSKVYDENIINDLISKLEIKEKTSYDFYIKKEFVGPLPGTYTQLKYMTDLKKLELLKISDINFKKFGWVKHAAEFLEITPQKVNKWLKRMDIDFYNTCFIRTK